MDDSPFKEPDAMGSLRELVQETEEQDDPEDTGKNLIISGAAMLGAAVVVGLVGWWLLKGALAAAHDAGVTKRPGHQNDGSDVVGLLALLGSGVLFSAAVLGVFGLVSVAKVVMRKIGR